jgi:hypothetical protein
VVLNSTVAATSSAATWEPTLKPYQPNHSSPAPSSTSGRLCGFICSRGNPRRLPSTNVSARAAAPALMCTAVPPAKSSAPRRAAIQPSSRLKTQWQTGKYTTLTHSTTNSTQPPNLARSAMAPLIRAVVRMANIIWKLANTSTGTVPLTSPTVPAIPKKSNPPTSPLPCVGPKAIV